jgi:RNA polymerase primary sigma factor
MQRPTQEGAGDDEAPSLSELLHDQKALTPDQQLLNDDELRIIRLLLDVIDMREAVVLNLRFGLDGDEPVTLKEVGQMLELTRERVRQIEAEAMKKLHQRLQSDDPFSPEHDPKPRRRGRRPGPSRPTSRGESDSAQPTNPGAVVSEDTAESQAPDAPVD